MKHHKSIRKFGRPKRQRTALLRSLARSLVIHDKIATTEAKAKEVRPYIEKMITRAKSGTVASARFLSAQLGKGAASKKVLDVLAPKYKDRKGGYTRITKLPVRATDAAKLAMIEFV